MPELEDIVSMAEESVAIEQPEAEDPLHSVWEKVSSSPSGVECRGRAAPGGAWAERSRER
jgi:hypothetical protein